VIKDKIAGAIKARKKFIPIVAILLAAAVYFAISARESIYVGTIEVTEVDVAPRITSQIAKRIADEGDTVKLGDVLYKLTCEDQTVAADKATKDFKRAEKLLASGNMSPEQYDKFEANYEYAMYDLQWCTVRSPMNGTILTKFHEAGDYVNPGTKLVAMGDLNDVWAYVYVDQPKLATISIGEDVTGVLPELHSKKIPGRVIRIKDEAEFTPKNVQTRKERTRLVYGVKIRFDNSEQLLKPGMPIEVWFPPLAKK
jgi:HlyD family secretion protein